MINTLKPAAAPGHESQRGEILQKVQQQYGQQEEKQREASKKLGKDEFFKIMVTQIQHQDPLKPYQNEQMAAQMAQFTSLEQMVNVNQNLEKLAQAQQPLHNLGAANLIGKYVTADSSRILHTEGKYSDLNFTLPADAVKVRVNLINEKGESIRQIEAANLKKGPNTLQWDGKKSNNMPAPSGQYMMQIIGMDEKDRAVQVQTQKSDVVHGVAFEGKETILLVGNPAHPEKLLLRNVSRIVDGAPAPQAGIAGLPPGMEIGGLENLIPKPEGAEERQVEGYVPGAAAQYSPVDLEVMRKAQEKPIAQQAPSNEEIRRIIAEGPDLSHANPLAEAARRGAPLPAEANDANPAAMERLKTGVAGASQVAAGQAIPSGADGSTAGKWTQ